MIKKSSILLLSLGTALCALAEQLSPAEALSRVYGDAFGMHRAPALWLETTPVMEMAVDGAEANAYYVFNAKVPGSGFAVVAADDCVPNILLGYSDEGEFDPQNIPENMQWWLSVYAQEIGLKMQNLSLQAPDSPQRAERADIMPMVHSKWNQGVPFNNTCPLVNGKRSVTGCVATAMAQIMYFHKWPKAAAKGENGYSWSVENVSYDVYKDFSKVTFDWKNMLDSYDECTQENIDAVAELMECCGVATNMNYTPESSGTQSTLIASALIDYFDYDKGIQYLSRKAYTREEWEEIIYNELAARRPVQYSGRTLDGAGHAFVCDGYRDGYFHINWGWGGSSDGYFLTTTLDPNDQGIGGAQSGSAFVGDQRIIVGIQKNMGTTAEQPVMLELNGSLGTDKTEYVKGEDAEILFSGKPGNAGYRNFTGSVGLEITKESTGQISSRLTIFEINDLPPSYYYTDPFSAVAYDDLVKGLSFGTYIMRPIYKRKGESTWYPMLVDNNLDTELYMTYSAGKIKIEAMEKERPQFSAEALLTPLHIGRVFSVKATATVSQEYSGKINIAFIPTDNAYVKFMGDWTHVTISAPSQQCIYTGTLTQYGEEGAGTYRMLYIDENYNVLSPAYLVDITADPGEPTVSISDFRCTTGSTAPRSNLQFDGTLICESGYFDDIVPVYIFPAEGGYSLSRFTSNFVALSAGYSTQFAVSGEFMQGVPGEKYMVIPYIGGALDYNNIILVTLTDDGEDPGPEPDYGDVDGNYEIELLDATTVIDFVNGQKVTSAFDQTNADVNKDGAISVLDARMIVSHVVNGSFPAEAPADGTQRASTDARFEMNNFYIAPGEMGVLEVGLYQANRFVAAQFELELPAELTIESYKIGGTNTTHKVVGSDAGLGYNRYVVYSETNNAFSGDVLVEFTIRASDDLTGNTGTISLKNSYVDLRGTDGLMTQMQGIPTNTMIGYLGITSPAVDNVNVWAEGSVLCIRADSEGVLVLSDMLGRTRQLSVAPGVNTFELPAGVYAIQGKKIVIK